ncbi:MAG: guanylate kinase [Clostridia bacterium]|nr:guanylate kinase [Clostridia bacterium]
MIRQGMLLVVSGPSGAGKGTLCKALMGKYQEVRYSISATTRPPRTGERDGEDYFFKSREEFEVMIAQEELLEWAPVHDNYYGTPRLPVMEALAGGNDIILEIDVQGALQVKEKFPDAVFIYILPPSMKELEQRLINRGTDSPEIIAKRMKNAVGELAYVNRYDYVIINDSMDAAAVKLEAVILAERCRPKRVDYRVD